VEQKKICIDVPWNELIKINKWDGEMISNSWLVIFTTILIHIRYNLLLCITLSHYEVCLSADLSINHFSISFIYLYQFIPWYIDTYFFLFH
jgi:hypothetical protein